MYSGTGLRRRYCLSESSKEEHVVYMNSAILVDACLAVSASQAVSCEGSKEVELESPSSKACYAFGMDMGNSIAKMSEELCFEVDLVALLRGIEDTVRRRKALLSREEARLAKVTVVAKGRKVRRELGEKNKKETEKFLAANRMKEGIVSTDSGLQYAILREGEGKRPAATDAIKISFRGSLIDGTEFTNTYKSGKPERHSVNKLLAGLREALQLMRVGAKYRLFLPPELGYGERGRGRLIPPYATLVYELELLGSEAQESEVEKTGSRKPNAEMEKKTSEREAKKKSHQKGGTEGEKKGESESAKKKSYG
jgi:FKBP-type peptidyl-prolyl cis-trans isomerase